MATDLTYIFGTSIRVEKQPRFADRQYTGYPGAHGLTSMFMGTRGYILTIRGRLAAYGPDYDNGRAALQEIIDDIETYLWAEYNDYTFMNETFYNIVFERLLIPVNDKGKQFYWTPEGYVCCEFTCEARGLL